MVILKNQSTNQSMAYFVLQSKAGFIIVDKIIKQNNGNKMLIAFIGNILYINSTPYIFLSQSFSFF